jgi:two-component system nitrate/nitrite response regulator NarL
VLKSTEESSFLQEGKASALMARMAVMLVLIRSGEGASGKELVQTVRVLNQGQSFISPSLAAKLLMKSGPGSASEARGSGHLPHLTPREQQILSILAQGRSNKEIGNKLDLSEKTIKHHLTNILQKLRVRNRVEAALMASNRLPQSLLAS